jgi:hypothetical protein
VVAPCEVEPQADKARALTASIPIVVFLHIRVSSSAKPAERRESRSRGEP